MDAARKAELARDLEDLTQRFWAGEAEICRAFFSVPRSAEEHAHWLRLQVWKEMYGSGLVSNTGGIIRGFMEDLRDRIERLETRAQRDDFERDLRVLREEFTHYKLFADVLENATRKPLVREEMDTWQLPEDRELQQVRNRIRTDGGRLGQLAVMATEGGGSSLFFEGRKIGGDAISDQIAAACNTVFTDELEHGEHGENALEAQLETDEEWAQVRAMVTSICQQRLRMRYGMFALPVDEQRIQEITEGKIENRW